MTVARINENDEGEITLAGFDAPIAITTVIDGKGWRLVVCVKDQPGYHPTSYPRIDNEDNATNAAYSWNKRLGLSETDAALIIASTMRRTQPQRRQRS